MTMRYYFTIQYIPAHADCGLLAGRSIHQMHQFMVNNPMSMNQIGVSFPNWEEGSIGNTIAFVASEKDMLIGLAFQPYFSLMVKEGLFESSSVCEVPADTLEVRFVRNQTIGKSFIGSKKRRIRRSLVRAELSGERQSLPAANEVREVDHFHRIPISSGSSGQDYILHIQKEFVNERSVPNFNSYGFATIQEKRGTVPSLCL